MLNNLSEEERLLVSAVERFSCEVLAPRAGELDESEASATLHLPALGGMGVMGLNLPEEWGGPGVSPFALYRSIEAIAAACGSTASMVTAHFLATDAVLIAGNDCQRRSLLPRAAAGGLLGAFALTEPLAGSNPADMRCTALRTGSGYRLRGVKHFISNAGMADFIVVFALTDESAGAHGISAFALHPASLDGTDISSPERTMGLRGGHIFELRLDCTVPADAILGAEGSGFRTAMKVLDRGRVDVAAQATGIAMAALDASLSWAKIRQVGGAPIARFQGLQWMLADMATELEASRALAFSALAKRASGESFTLEASMAKLYATEAASRIADKALQIHGGYGYSRSLPLERYLRDLRVFRIYEGSSEIQRNIIARSLLGPMD